VCWQIFKGPTTFSKTIFVGGGGGGGEKKKEKNPRGGLKVKIPYFVLWRQLITVALINITVRKYKQLSEQLRTMHRLYATEHMYVYMDIVKLAGHQRCLWPEDDVITSKHIVVC
jgi:hypothetical protein